VKYTEIYSRRSQSQLALLLSYNSRAVNNDLLDTYQLKSLDGLLETEVEGITLERREGKLWVRFNNSMDMEMASDADSFALREGYDDVISCLGFKFDSTIFHRWASIARKTRQTQICLQ
jgi:hypothetical protein